MTEKDISLVRGDTKNFTIKIKDSSGNARDLTGSTVNFVIARAGQVYLQKAVTSHSNPTGGESLIQVQPTDWPTDKQLYDSGYVYEIEIRFSENEVYTLVRGKASIIDDIIKD